jgi:hypothetical protein
MGVDEERASTRRASGSIVLGAVIAHGAISVGMNIDIDERSRLTAS